MCIFLKLSLECISDNCVINILPQLAHGRIRNTKKITIFAFLRSCRDFTKSASGGTNNTGSRTNWTKSGKYVVEGNVKRAQREFWTDFCPDFGQNAARKAGMKRYEKKRKNENIGFYDFTKSAVFEDEFCHGLITIP